MASRRGITHIKPNESGPRAGSPNFSKAHTGSGFAWGIQQVSKASQSASPMPKGIANATGKGLKPRKGVWHPGAEKP